MVTPHQKLKQDQQVTKAQGIANPMGEKGSPSEKGREEAFSDLTLQVEKEQKRVFLKERLESKGGLATRFSQIFLKRLAHVTEASPKA